jgi:hypothetical protein
MPEVTIAAAFYYHGNDERRQPPEPWGGSLERHHPHLNCPTWASAAAEPATQES